MGYTIYADYGLLIELGSENLEINALEKDKDKIMSLCEFKEFIEHRYDKKYDLVIDELEEDEKQKAIDDFMKSEYWYEYVDSMRYPMYNAHHVLQTSNPEYELPIFMELKIPAVTINNIYKLDANVLSLIGAGMDFSESLELAYYVFDGVSPVKANNVYYLNDKLKELLLFCREKVKEHSYVTPNEIKHKWEELNA